VAVVVGVDLGTTATKAVGYDETGRKLASAAAGYPLAEPQPGCPPAATQPAGGTSASCACSRPGVDGHGRMRFARHRARRLGEDS
jgi:ribulose kinase